MGAPGLRELKNRRTREAIERAALELALEQGFDHTTVDQIAARAEVSPRTVFVRYPTKEAIFFPEDEDNQERMQALLDGGAGDLLDRIVEFLQGAIARGRAQDPLGDLRLRVITQDPHLRQVFRAKFDELERLMAGALATERGLSPDDPGVRVFAAGINAIFLSLIDCALRDPDADLLREIDSGLRFLRAGLDTLR